MNNTEEGEEKEIFEFLRMVVGAIEERDCLLLMNAMRYADVDTYTVEPKSVKEKILNEIFEIKAVSYFKRKKLEYSGDIDGVYAIRNHEHHSISILRNQLPI